MVKEFHCELRFDYDLAAILPDGWLQEGILVVLGSLVAYSKELLYASESVDIIAGWFPFLWFNGFDEVG